MVTEVSIPAAVSISTVCQRSSIGAQWGSKIRRMSSRSVVIEKLTRRLVRAASDCSSAQIADNQRPSGLDHKHARRTAGDGLQQTGHEAFRPLPRVDTDQ